MATPTAPRVMAREDTPAEYRPGNQARLVPSAATNFSNTNDMIPGMGIVQSGNGYDDNGLAPRSEARNFRNSVSHMHRKMAQLQKAGSPNMPPSAQVESIEQALSTGRQKPYWRQNIVIQDARKIQKGEAVNITPAPGTPLTTGMSRLMQGQRPVVLTGAGTNKGRGDAMWSGSGDKGVQKIYAPTSPAPDADEPAGYNYQSDRNQIIDMQAGVSPVSAINGLSGLATSPLGLVAIGAAYWFFFRKGT